MDLDFTENDENYPIIIEKELKSDIERQRHKIHSGMKYRIKIASSNGSSTVPSIEKIYYHLTETRPRFTDFPKAVINNFNFCNFLDFSRKRIVIRKVENNWFGFLVKEWEGPDKLIAFGGDPNNYLFSFKRKIVEKELSKTFDSKVYIRPVFYCDHSQEFESEHNCIIKIIDIINQITERKFPQVLYNDLIRINQHEETIQELKEDLNKLLKYRFKEKINLLRI